MVDISINKKAKIAVLGAGSWGNTLSFLFAQNQEVILWDHNPSRVRKANKTRRFKKPIKQRYPDNVIITSNLEDIKECKLIINAVPVKGIADVFSKCKEMQLSEDVIIMNGSKGVEPNSLQSPTEIIQSFCPKNPIAVISGPNLAKEVILGKPMVTHVAAKDIETAQLIQEYIKGPTLRVYASTDVIGVELCGALKNVMAIAAGWVDGLDLGQSAKASLITRSLNEIGKFLEVYGGKQSTLLSAAGIGDLIATCESELSRNYRVGYALAKGKKLDQIIDSLGEVAEGVNTTHAVYRLCQERGLSMPIVEQIKLVLDGKITVVEAGLNLMNRPLGS